MKQAVIAYLAKDGITREELIDTSTNPTLFEINDANLSAQLFLKKSENMPKWLDLFEDVDIAEDTKIQTSIRGVLVVESRGRLLALTFGHGRSLINQQMIVRGFGLRVALNLGDPKQLKSLDKSTVDKVALNTRSQSARNTGVEDFGFEHDHEILKSLSAVVINDDNLEIVSGNDSVSLYTEVQLDIIQSIADRLFDAYELDVFRQAYPWIEYIKPEPESSINNALDQILIHALNDRQYQDFWMAPPDMIDYTNFSGFGYREIDSPYLDQELNLSNFLTNTRFRGDITISSFKNKKIFIYDASGECTKKWSAFRCLNGEIDYDGNRYILNDGRWYQIKQSFYDEVCDYFNELDISELQFPEHQGLREGPYLRSIANDVDLVLLDQKWVRPDGVSNNLEFCDLLSQCNGIIHVKKYGSSALLNHLFAQAYQSIEMLVNSPEVIDQVNVHLNGTALNLAFDHTMSPRNHRIILAIMDHRTEDFTFPFFAKVSLRHYARKIKSMGFNVELAKIPIGNRLSDEQLAAQI